MPEGHRFRTHVLGLAIVDGANSEMIAEVQDSTGELHPPNVVVYPDCFTDVKGAIRFTYKRDLFEQDIIIYERFSLPPGYNPATTKLEIWNEIVESPASIKTTRVIDNNSDDHLNFGAMRIGSGRAFALEDPQGAQWSTPMYKTWTVAEGRTFLVEAVEFSAIQEQLNALPLQAAVPRAAPLGGNRQQMAKNAAGQRIFPRRQQAAKAGGKIQMAALLSRPSGTLSSTRSGGEGRGEEADGLSDGYECIITKTIIDKFDHVGGSAAELRSRVFQRTSRCRRITMW